MANRAVILGAIAATLGVAALYSGSGRLSGHGVGIGGGGCSIEPIAAEDGVAAVHADCRWLVPAERVTALLEDVNGHGRFFTALAETSIIGKSGDHLFVREVHHAKGMSDREVVVEWWAESLPDGHRYRWRKAADQSAVSGTRVQVAETQGYWEVVREGEQTHLVYEMHYLPGGNIPAFLVRMFQAPGIKNALGELRDAAQSDKLFARRD